MHIGNHIEEVIKQDGRSARWLAERIPTERTNVYNIFHREFIDTRLLMRISVVMNHDFFADLSEEFNELVLLEGEFNETTDIEQEPSVPTKK